MAVDITLPFHTCLEDGEKLFIMRCIISFCRQVFLAEIYNGVEPIMLKGATVCCLHLTVCYLLGKASPGV